MLSENVERVLAAEKECDKMLADARERKAAALIRAEETAKAEAAEALKKARAEAEAVRAEADGQIAKIYSDEQKKNGAVIESLKNRAASLEKTAVDEVKRLILN